MPPLVTAPEVRNLTDRLGQAARGEAFLLQGGDCAETFAANTANQIRDKVKTLLQMAVVLTYGASMPVVKVARIAGQYAKPRSADIEKDTGLPSYRGDAVNALEPTAEARRPNPQRMLAAYHHSAITLNLIRAFATGGFADLSKTHEWNRAFVRDSSAGRRYEAISTDIDRALAFMAACGIDLERTAALHGVELYTSHEGLLLEYERGPDPHRGRDRRRLRPVGAHDLDRRAHPRPRRRPCRTAVTRRQPARLQGGSVGLARRGAGVGRPARPRARPRPADPDLEDGCQEGP